MTDSDRIYSERQSDIVDFQFNESVVRVFPDMIKRSVPGYTTIITMIEMLAERYCRDNTNCYDLGCSLGAATLSLRHGANGRNCRIIAVDNSPAMIQQCDQIIEADGATVPIDLVCADVESIAIENASIVVLNFTLQFIQVESRLEILRRIADGLNAGGILILSEKIAFANPQADELFIEMHHQFKKHQGYSDLEISQKRTALENVLIPEPLSTHVDRLGRAGFVNSEVWFQCFNFASLVAWK